MIRAIGHQTGIRDHGRTALLVGGVLFSLAAPAAIVGTLWLASVSSGNLLAMVLTVLAADPTTLGLREAILYWGMTGSAIGTWLVGAGLVLDGLVEG